MSIFKENYDNKANEFKQSFAHPEEAFGKQSVKMQEMNNTSLKEHKQESVLTATGLESVMAEQLKTDEIAQNKTAMENRDSYAMEREVRKRAEKKTSSAAKLKNKLQELGESGKSFDEVIKSNYLIFKINSFNAESNPSMSEEDIEKIEALKEQAPIVYKRLLELENVLSHMDSRQEPDLYRFTMSEKQQAQEEWDYVQNMADTVHQETDTD